MRVSSLHQWHGYRQKKAVAQQIYCKHRQVGASLVWEIALRGKAWNLALVSVAIVMQKSMAFLFMPDRKDRLYHYSQQRSPFPVTK